MPQKKTIRENIQKLTKGAVNTLTDLILLELLMVGDFLTGPRTLSGVFYHLQKNLQFVEERRLKTALSNTRAKGWIDYHGLLTELGKTKINSKIKLARLGEKWSGAWLIVVFDIPEKQRRARNIFRLYLKAKKFGKFQESVWISPYQRYRSEVESMRNQYRLKPFVFTFLTKNVGGLNPKQLAENVWRLSALNKKYHEYIQEYTNTKVHPLERIGLLLAIMREDPRLPKELLPQGWKGEEVLQIYRHILKRRPS